MAAAAGMRYAGANQEDSPMRLLDMLDHLDRLHADRLLDIRHREKFVRQIELAWPHLSARLRDLVDRAGPPVVALALVA